MLSHHGDLTAADQAVLDPSSIVQHTIQLKRASDDGEHESNLGARLDLGVGGSGVIGRMLSITCGGRQIGNGVIGWN